MISNIIDKLKSYITNITIPYIIDWYIGVFNFKYLYFIFLLLFAILLNSLPLINVTEHIE